MSTGSSINPALTSIISEFRRMLMNDAKVQQSLLSVLRITSENIDPLLKQELMLNKQAQERMLPQPKINTPKIMGVKGETVAKPLIMKANIAQMVGDLLEGNNIYLLGKAGTGKTYLAEAMAESVLNQKKYMINCSQWTSPIEIRGGQTIEGYKEGTVIEAWANGGMLILDELPKLDPNTAGILNQALAESSAQPKYDSDGNLIENTIPSITNGAGISIKKGEKLSPDDPLRFRFCVVGTGNTDMMTVGNKYGGNQKQDYSLVDRFSGSFYWLESDPALEMELTYAYVYTVCSAIRKWCEAGQDIPLSISLRTMLNFNRTYEQEMLSMMDSPFADKIYDNDGNVQRPKGLTDSVGSFKNMLPTNELKSDFQKMIQGIMDNPPSSNQEDFTEKYIKKYGFEPESGRVATCEREADTQNTRGRLIITYVD